MCQRPVNYMICEVGIEDVDDSCPWETKIYSLHTKGHWLCLYGINMTEKTRCKAWHRDVKR